MIITLNETQIERLAGLYNAIEILDDQFHERMLKAQRDNNDKEFERAKRFREVCRAKECAYDDVLKILGLCDTKDAQGYHKIVRR